MSSAIFPGLDWLDSASVVERSGWVLVHSVWQFGVVSLLALLLSRTLRRASASARYAMLVAAMMLVVAAPVATWYCLMIDSRVDVAPSAQITLSQPDAGPERPAVADGAILIAITDAESPEWQQSETDRQPQPLSVVTEAPSVESLLPWTVRFADVVHPWLPRIVGMWCVGVLLFSVRPAWSWCVVRRLKTAGVSPVADVVQQTLDRMCARLMVGRRVRVLQSTLVTSPIVVGCFRSVILLPASFIAGVPLSQLEAILAHELAHVRRYDYVVNLLQTLVETLFFYHPAVWWLSHRIRIERENCCDDLVVTVLGDRVEYGRALLAVEQFRSTATGSLALGVNDGSLLSRVRRMVGDSSLESQPDRFGQSGLIVLLSCGVLAAAAWAFVLAAEPVRETSPPMPLVAVLPNGAKVELLAVGYHQWRRNEWWNPNGTALAADPDDAGLRRITLSKATAPGRQQDCREFAVRITGLPEGSHYFGYHYVFDDLADFVHRAVMDQLGEFRMGTFARTANDPDAGFSLRVGMDEHPDLLVRSLDATGRKVGEEPQSELARKLDALIQPVGTTEIDGRAGLILKRISRDWLRDGPLVRESAPEAIDVSGKRYQAIDSENRPENFIHVYDLPLNEVQRFEYRFGVFESWVTFENVSLQPGRKTEARAVVDSLPEREDRSVESSRPPLIERQVSLNMTEARFLEIVKQQELKVRKTVDGGSTTYAIGLGDGHTLLVMFGNNGDKCSGIQRIRGEDEEPSESDDPEAGVQAVAPALEFRIVAQAADSQLEPRVPVDFANRDYPGNSAIARSMASDKGFVWVSVTDWSDQDVAEQPVERRLDGKVRQILLSDTPTHAMPFDGKWSVEECRAAPDPDGDQFQIRIRLNGAGDAAMRKLTGSHLNQSLAIVVGNQIIAAPIIRNAIGGDIAISGNFTREQAERLAMAIRGQPPADTPASERSDKAAPVSVKGRVLIDGPIPVVPPLLVKRNLIQAIPRNDDERRRNDEIARNAVTVEMPDDSLVVGDDGGVANVVIYLRQAPSDWNPTPPPTEVVEISCGDHRFEPHVSFVRVGQSMRVLGPKQDADTFSLQSIHAQPLNVLILAARSLNFEKPFLRSEAVPVRVISDIHPWMQAWILALDHPFAAITDADGRFEIRGLPPGEHHFRVWHERRGYLERDLVIHVEADKVATANLNYPAERFAPRETEPAGNQPPLQDNREGASDAGDPAGDGAAAGKPVVDRSAGVLRQRLQGLWELAVIHQTQGNRDLPNMRFEDRRLGRDPARELRRLEVKPSVVSADGKGRSFDWDECSCLQNRDDSDVSNLIDHASCGME